jgi:hypothetical protein
MKNHWKLEALLLGIFFCLGLFLFGHLMTESMIRFKELNRSVTVKGLAEREVPADLGIWPIKFNEASNALGQLYSELQTKNTMIVEYLKTNGFEEEEISASVPSIVDRQAQGYSDPAKIAFRYTGSSTITVYSKNVALVRKCMQDIGKLGKRGIVFAGQDYHAQAEFLFTGLNQIKPQMVEQATKKAREVALKFAKDSQSTLGKIKTARQGLFSIRNRDRNTPYIKKVRVVSTLEYYLTD